MRRRLPNASIHNADRKIAIDSIPVAPPPLLALGLDAPDGCEFVESVEVIFNAASAVYSMIAVIVLPVAETALTAAPLLLPSYKRRLGVEVSLTCVTFPA